MIDQLRLKKSLRETFKSPIHAFEIEQLAGDASDRVYYRLSWQEKGLSRTYILMAMAHAEAAKTSDEVADESAPPILELPFINIQKHLFDCNITVPEIFMYDEEQGWLILEDLGNMTFADKIKTHLNAPETLLDYYKKAIDPLIAIQRYASPILSQKSIAHMRHYTQALFEWEFDHFIEYGIEKRNGSTLKPAIKKEIQSYFSDLSTHFSALPQFFTHRDYHSRNLMIQETAEGTKIRIIDFQDALMGPAEYDLASLLRDSYIDLPSEIIEVLLDYYIRQWKEHAGRSIDRNLFQESFDLISIQRNLKAAGRFVYIDQIKGKDHLLPFLSPTLLKVEQTLKKYNRLKPLYDLLAKNIPEWQ